MQFYAHTRNLHGTRHSLVRHLNSVADLTQTFASDFGAEGLAYSAGLWHDVGKIDPAFQEYLDRCETDPERRHFGPDHKGLGTREATRIQQLLAFLINGHHGGIPSGVDLKNKLRTVNPSEETRKRLQRLIEDLLRLLDPPIDPPSFAQSNPFTAEFFIRMLFSTLVDAGFLDTEGHFLPHRSSLRDDLPPENRSRG